MKAIYLLMVSFVALSGTVFAGPDVIIKQHAKDIRDQNNVRQGVASPSTPAPPSRAASTAPTVATPTPVQQSIAKVRADLTAVVTGSSVTPQQKQQLSRDLLATVQGASKPSSATVDALANELLVALAHKQLPESARNRMLSNLAAVLNPANIQSTQMQAIYSDIQAIFQANGMARSEAVKIVDAVKAVGAETRR